MKQGKHLRLAEILTEETELLDGPFPDHHPVKVLSKDDPAGTRDKELLDELRRHVHARHPKRAGLCFSGGGIRSATFGLGVLQSLARLQLLDKFDYLSTVSGGGYIGSWLTAWIHRHPRGLSGVIDDLNHAPKTGSAEARHRSSGSETTVTTSARTWDFSPPIPGRCWGSICAICTSTGWSCCPSCSSRC